MAGAPEESTTDCVVVGAGVVGLAVARALALRGREVVLLEAAGTVGTETSSRHSEVIHAGIYYPEGSLKARLCVDGKQRLYDFCARHGVPHRRITKLIVATSREQLPELRAFRSRAARHGVPDLQLLSGGEARGLEPALRAEGALLSPSTGILDSHAYMAALLADAEAHGALLALRTRVVAAREQPAPISLAPRPPSSTSSTSSSSSSSSSTGSATSSCASRGAGAGSSTVKVLHLETALEGAGGSGPVAGRAGHAAAGGVLEAGEGGAAVERSVLRARWVINCGGLHARRVAAALETMPRGAIPPMWFAKGNYFSLSGPSPFSRLIYPMPERGLAGLGTHLTLDMGGAAKFGPDVEWLPGAVPHDPAAPVALDYRVDPSRAASFYPAIRRFFPALPDGALQPDYSGVRPKLSGPGQPAADFLVQGPEAHGIRGWVNLYGIESPGLTSSLALAEHVCGVLGA